MIIFLYGQDTYRSCERLKILRKAFIDKFDSKGLNIDILYGDSLEIEEFRKAILSQGLLSKKRFIVVKNLITEKRNVDFYEDLITSLKELKSIDDVILIFWEGSDLAGKKRGNKLYNYLQKSDKVEEYKFLNPGQLSQWIIKNIKIKKGKISKQAVDYLAANVGSDLWSMSGEINKLIAFKNKGLIKLEDVEKFVSLALNDNIFHFTDALANKNTKQALKLFSDQLASGANEFYLLTMLVRQFRILLQIKQAIESGITSQNMQVELKLHPFVIKKSLSQVRKFNQIELKKNYNQLLDIDIKLKTTGISPEVLFSLFIVEACQ